MQVYCDMDSVLVEFLGPAIEAINEVLTLSLEGKPVPERYQPAVNAWRTDVGNRLVLGPQDFPQEGAGQAQGLLRAVVSDNHDFWANLPWHETGKQVWGEISETAHVLSAPMRGRGCKTGKREWVKNKLNIPLKRLHLNKNKGLYALDDDGEPNLLIDDYIPYVEQFRAAGGVAIHHVNIKDTLEALNHLRSAGFIR